MAPPKSRREHRTPRQGFRDERDPSRGRLPPHRCTGGGRVYVRTLFKCEARLFSPAVACYAAGCLPHNIAARPLPGDPKAFHRSTSITYCRRTIAACYAAVIGRITRTSCLPRVLCDPQNTPCAAGVNREKCLRRHDLTGNLTAEFHPCYAAENAAVMTYLQCTPAAELHS